MKTVTLLFLRNLEERTILLAMKKRGFGEGKLNGVGGKVQEGETIPQAAIREAQEEIGVRINESDITQVGQLRFAFDDHPEWEFDCHVFVTTTWEGEPAESDEMAPQWYHTDALPYDRMWVDDQYWLPLVLDGTYVDASFVFSEGGSAVKQAVINGKESVYGA